jgi:hypothetical protein
MSTPDPTEELKAQIIELHRSMFRAGADVPALREHAGELVERYRVLHGVTTAKFYEGSNYVKQKSLDGSKTTYKYETEENED